MNQPDRYEKFVVPDGTAKIAFVKDTKLADAGTFIIQREDHTIGNLVRMQLHRDELVTFAGYRIPHPLEYTMQVKVQTTTKSTPRNAMKGALDDLAKETAIIQHQFKDEVQKMKGPLR